MGILAGKKTYLVAGGLVLLGAWLVYRGSTDQGAETILLGLGLTSLGDRVNRHRTELLAAIKDAGAVAADVRSGKDSQRDIEKLAGDGAKVAAESFVVHDGVTMPPLTDARVDAIRTAMINRAAQAKGSAQ